MFSLHVLGANASSVGLLRHGFDGSRNIFMSISLSSTQRKEQA
jgi:hypothetical protein